MNSKFEKLSTVIVSLLTRIHEYCSKQVEHGQPFGLCIANPKHALVGHPTKDIKAELEKRATEHFQQTQAPGYYFHYWTPPILPLIDCKDVEKSITAEDYQLAFELPQFDEMWQINTLARSLIYCPLDQEHDEWSDWFELQVEAIRLVPLLHQTLKESGIKKMVRTKLGEPGLPIFEDFIYEYAQEDSNFPKMGKGEREQWKRREVDWRERYHLAVNVLVSSLTLREMYIAARNRAASSRNLVLKPLFWAFVDHVEKQLVWNTELPKNEKDLLITELRKTKKRPSKGKHIAKRPAICISDVECAQILYLLIQNFLSEKQKMEVLAEAIIFIWIAQHGAFSGLRLKVEDILSIRVADIDSENLTVALKNQEIHISGGLNEVLLAWLSSRQRKNRLFQNLSYDNLEDIISKCSEKLYSVEGRLLPRDFLEKVHIIPGARIPLDLRRQITAQEELIKSSPYRVDSQAIKKNIRNSTREKRAQDTL